jgi:hypothetical protein
MFELLLRDSVAVLAHEDVYSVRIDSLSGVFTANVQVLLTEQASPALCYTAVQARDGTNKKLCYLATASTAHSGHGNTHQMAGRCHCLASAQLGSIPMQGHSLPCQPLHFWGYHAASTLRLHNTPVRLRYPAMQIQ